MMGDEFIKLPSGVILNISCIESLSTITRQIGYDTKNVQYEKYLLITTKSKGVYREDINFLDTILKNIYVVNLESKEK